MGNNSPRIIRLQETDSTNRVAMEMGLAGEAPGTVVVTETQTAGRGRLGREWLSPFGTGLYFSVILLPRLDPADLAKITLAAGLAMCMAVERVSSLSPRLKWPNDLLLEGKKFGGILTESGPVKGEGDTVVIIGVGLNLADPSDGYPPEMAGRATSLAAEGAELDREILLAEALSQLDLAVECLEKQCFTDILAAWKERDATLGKELEWVADEGKVVRGVSLGPDDEGILHIRDAGGAVHSVISGDLRLNAE